MAGRPLQHPVLLAHLLAFRYRLSGDRPTVRYVDDMWLELRVWSKTAIAVFAALVGVTAIAAATPAAAPRSPQHSGVSLAQPPAPEGRALLDGFETDPWPDPGLWTLPADTAPMWWPSSCRAKTGRRSLWAFGGPTVHGERSCDAAAPPGTSNVLVTNLDLTDTLEATRLDLYFDLWLEMPPGDEQGLFIHLLVPGDNGGTKRVPVFGATGIGGQWSFPARRLDLLALADIEDPDFVYDLRGDYWRLEWTAVAPDGTPRGGGLFIDNVELVWEPYPAVATPTVRPTETITPSPSPTKTATRRATPTASASPSSPPPGELFLPLLHKLHPEPTETATPGAVTATATASASAPATSTPTTTATPTATPTATAAPHKLHLPMLRKDPEPTATPTATMTPTGAVPTHGTPAQTPTPSATASPSATETTVPTPPPSG